jgi:hypothetical protein
MSMLSALGNNHMFVSLLIHFAHFLRTVLVLLMAHMCWQGCLDTSNNPSGVGRHNPHKMSWLLWTLTSSSPMSLLVGRVLLMMH